MIMDTQEENRKACANAYSTLMFIKDKGSKIIHESKRPFFRDKCSSPHPTRRKSSK
jgi:hypothetical protein